MIFSSETCPPPSTASALSESQKQLCNSSASSKYYPESALHAQIAQLKQKAHQSFMQVIQMQQLHDEQLHILTTEQEQRENSLMARIQELEERVTRSEELELRVQQLENENSAMERNYKMHFLDLDEDQLSIDNIEIITAERDTHDDNGAHLKEVLQMFQKELDFQKIRVDLIKEVGSALQGRSCNPEESLLFQLTNKTLAYVASVRIEWNNFLQRQSDREAQISKQFSSNKGYQALQREGKFMAEHIKRLSTQKLRAQKRAAQAERQLRNLQEKISKIQVSLDKRGITLAELPKHKSPGLLGHDHSLEIEEFVSENLKNSTNSNPHPTSIRSNHHQLLVKGQKR